MKPQALVLALLITLVPGVAFAFPPAAEIVDPETECRQALRFLESVPDGDRIFIRFLSIYTVPPQQRQEFALVGLRVAIRQLTLSPNRRVFPARVPDSGTLYWLDLRSYQWNHAAWRAVALRDVRFREPWVHFDTARKLRGLVGEYQPTNFAVLTIVDGFSLYRRTYQTVESADYYDLLFAEQRYPVSNKIEYREVLRFFPGGKWTDGKTYPAGYYPYKAAFYQRNFVDFPKNREEWLSAFTGGTGSAEYEKALRALKSRRGAVVRGMEEDNDNISFVARNNRLAWLAPALSRFGAVYGETFDVKKPSGKRDLEENKARLEVSLEEEPPDIAIHTRDYRDRRVRNGGMACLACHGEFYCWIPLNNIIERTTPDEIDVKFKDKQAAEDYDAFFAGWQDDLKPIRETIRRHWLEATGDKRRKYEDGLTGFRVAQLSLRWKHEYDNPVTFEQACRETGAPEEILRAAASRSALRRCQDVARKSSVPRIIWDEDVYPELMNLLNASKERLFP